MATASADVPMKIEGGDRNSIPAVNADIIYEGSMVGDNASGYGRPLVAGDPFRGHCYEQCDNSAGAAGAKNIKVLTGRYRLQVTLPSVAITSVDEQVYASDDATYTLTPGSNTRVGIVTRYVTTNTAVVEFQTNEIAALVSDLTALLSNLVTVEGSSDIAAVYSDTAANKSDLVVVKSDVVYLKSDNTAHKSDIVVFKSDIVSEKSDTVVFKSDIVSEKSDTVVFKANRTKTLKGVSDAILAAAAGDYVNVSDIKVSLAEVLKAFSDGLI